MPFTAADIRELAYDPQAYMRRRQRLASGGGFGVPDLWWRYGAAEAFHRGDRSLEAVDAYLGGVLAGGCGPTQWKREKANVIRSQIADGYAPRTKCRRSISSMSSTPASLHRWLGAATRSPSQADSSSPPGGRGSLDFYGMRSVSPLGAAESICWWPRRWPAWRRDFQSRRTRSRFAICVNEIGACTPAQPLRAEWARLDALMTWAEHRPLMPPAA